MLFVMPAPDRLIRPQIQNDDVVRCQPPPLRIMLCDGQTLGAVTVGEHGGLVGTEDAPGHTAGEAQYCQDNDADRCGGVEASHQDDSSFSSASHSVTGCEHVKLWQTYAVALPSMALLPCAATGTPGEPALFSPTTTKVLFGTYR